MQIADILKYDLLRENPLFEGEFPKKPDKFLLVSELEKTLTGIGVTFNKTSELETVMIIDFMYVIRRMPITKVATFGDLLDATWYPIKLLCDYNWIDIVYDSYVKNSFKECERQRICI